MKSLRYLAAAALLAGCSSAGQPSSTTLPSVLAPQGVGPVRASFSIRWPREAKGKHGPRFISPSTMSAVVKTGTGRTATRAYANNNGSGISTIVIKAPVGKDLFVVSLYDQKQQSNQGKPAGKLLGQVTLVQKIVAGKLNTLVAVVNGLVRTVTIEPLPDQPYLEAAGRDGYAIVGQHGATLAVTPRDADGNAILAPGVTPGVWLKTQPANTYFAVLPGADPSQFQVVVTAPAPKGTFGFKAGATDARNHTVTATVRIGQRSEVYVAYATGQILAFDDAGTPLTLAAGAFAGLERPVSLAYDTTDETLFAADTQSGLIEGFTPDGAPRSGYTAPTLSGVGGVTWDPSLSMFEIIAVSPSSAIIASSRTGGPEGDSAIQSPFAVTGATGVAYMPGSASQTEVILVSNTSTGQLDAYTPFGVPTLFDLQHVTVGPPDGTPGAIAVDPTGMMAWVSGSVATAGELWRLPLVSGSPPEAAIADANVPAGLAYDARIDRLFVAESAAGSVAVYRSNLSGVDSSIVLTAPASSGAGNPQGVAIAY